MLFTVRLSRYVCGRVSPLPGAWMTAGVGVPAERQQLVLQRAAAGKECTVPPVLQLGGAGALPGQLSGSAGHGAVGWSLPLALSGAVVTLQGP